VVSLIGWLDGLTAAGIIFACISFGLLSLYEAKKYKIRLLGLAGLTMCLVGCFYLGPFCDLLSLLLTGKNLNPIYLYGYASYVWVALVIVCAMYFGAELILPEKKWYIVSFYLVIGIIFDLFLFFDTKNVFIFTLNNPGEGLIDATFNRSHICYYIIIIYLISAYIFLGMGFLIKAIQSEDILRKKFTYLSIAYQIFVLCAALDSLIPPGVTIGFVRGLMMTFALWNYLGLREEPEKKEKIKPKKDIKVKGDLFRISQYKKEDITEEEVSISKEKKICLVCKGKAIGITYICTECEAFYCVKCSDAISNLENMCWACDTPIDKSKPVKLYKKEVEEVEVEISEKPQKKPKVDKKSSKK